MYLYTSVGVSNENIIIIIVPRIKAGAASAVQQVCGP